MRIFLSSLASISTIPKADKCNAQGTCLLWAKSGQAFRLVRLSSGVSPSPRSQPRGSTVTNDRRVFAILYRRCDAHKAVLSDCLAMADRWDALSVILNRPY